MTHLVLLGFVEVGYIGLVHPLQNPWPLDGATAPLFTAAHCLRYLIEPSERIIIENHNSNSCFFLGVAFKRGACFHICKTCLPYIVDVHA